MEWYLLDEKIKSWLAEDMPYGDATSDPLFPDNHQCTGTFVAKEDGCVAGLLVAERVFKVLSDHVTMTILVKEGDSVSKGTPIAKISGRTRDILKGERLALIEAHNGRVRAGGVHHLALHADERLRSRV